MILPIPEAPVVDPMAPEMRAYLDRENAEHLRGVIHVMDKMPLAYTVGNSRITGLPELIVFGIADTNIARQVLHHLSRMIDRDIKPAYAMKLQAAAKHGVRLLEVERAAAVQHTPMIGAYFGFSHPYRLMQVVLPGANGAFPGEPGCDGDAATVPLLPFTEAAQAGIKSRVWTK